MIVRGYSCPRFTIRVCTILKRYIMRNRLRYTIYGFILAFVLSACGGPLDKSVTESLTPEESEEVGQKFPDFVGVYERFIFPEVRKWMIIRFTNKS